MERTVHDHLRGIVAIWLTNGQKPVDAGNETRYDMFDGGWMEAANATQTLYEAGMVEASELSDYGDIDVNSVTPTAKGVFEAMR